MAYYVKGKGWFESSGLPMGSQRSIDIARARAFGRQNDSAGLTRLVIESKVSRSKLSEAFISGKSPQRRD